MAVPKASKRHRDQHDQSRALAKPLALTDGMKNGSWQSPSLKRLRVCIDRAVDLRSVDARCRRLLLGVPAQAVCVEDVARHVQSRLVELQLRLPCTPPPLSLSVDGFVLPYSQRLVDVVREGDVITARETTASSAYDASSGSSAAVTILPAAAPAAIADASKSAGIPRTTKRTRLAAAGPASDLNGEGKPEVKVHAKPTVEVTQSANSSTAAAPVAVEAAGASEQISPALPSPAAGSALSVPVGTGLKGHPGNAFASGNARGRGGRRQAGGELPVTAGEVKVQHPQLGELEVPAGEDAEAFVKRKLRTLQKAVKRQVEYYFGDANWAKDEHLKSKADQSGYVDVAAILEFERLRNLTTDGVFVSKCLDGSAVVERSSCGTSLRRRNQSC